MKKYQVADNQYTSYLDAMQKGIVNQNKIPTKIESDSMRMPPMTTRACLNKERAWYNGDPKERLEYMF